MLGDLSHETPQCLLNGLKYKMTRIEGTYGLTPLNVVFLAECLICQQQQL